MAMEIVPFAPLDDDITALAPGFTAEDIAAMRAAFHSDLEDVTTDIKAGRTVVKAVEVTVDGIIIGTSKIGEGGFPSTLYFIVMGCPDPDHASGVIDCRNKEMKAEDKAKKFDYDADRVWTTSEVKAHGRDTEGIIRKVEINFEPFEVLSLGNEPQLKDLQTGLMASLRIELGAWHDKEALTVAVRHKLVSVLKRQVVPLDLLVEALFKNGACTRRYETEVGYYRKAMQEGIRNGGTVTDKEKNGLRYREKTMVIPIGFEDCMGYLFTMPNSAVTFDNTDITLKLKENFTDTRPGFNKPRFRCELIAEQWRGPNKRDATEITRCMLNVPMYETLFEDLGWKDMEAFQSIFPYVRKAWRMIIIGVEDAEKTNMSKLTQTRMYDIDPEDVEGINCPAPNNGLSFALSVMTRGILASSVAFLRSAGIHATGDAIKKYLWKNKSVPLPATEVKNNPLDLSRRIICLSEINGDVSAVLNDPKWELRVVVPVDSQTLANIGEIGKLSVADGSIFLGYVKECVTAKKGASVPKATFIRTCGTVLPPNHFIHKYDFTAASPNPLFYVFAIDREYYAKEYRNFVEAASTDYVGIGGILGSGKKQLAITEAPVAPAPAEVKGTGKRAREPSSEHDTNPKTKKPRKLLKAKSPPRSDDEEQGGLGRRSGEEEEEEEREEKKRDEEEEEEEAEF